MKSMMLFRRNDLAGTRQTKTKTKGPLKILLLFLYTVLLGTSIQSVSDIKCCVGALSISETKTPRGHRSPAPRQAVSNPARVGTKCTRLAVTGNPSSNPATTSKDPAIEWVSSRIEFEGVYRSYGPPSLWRKLTSSVPRREFALQDLTLAFGKMNNDSDGNNNSEKTLCLLLGASSSGKSTVLRSILEAGEGTKEFGNAENRGSLRIQSMPFRGQPSTNPTTSAATGTAIATPILLNDRGEVNNNASSRQPKTTIKEAWKDCILGAFGGDARRSEERKFLAMSLVDNLAEPIFELDPEALLVDLTPSEMYRFCLGKACIQSSVSTIGVSSNGSSSYGLPGPILLLDEWMDVETSAVVRMVQPSLHKIIEELNGIVISITHKPELYSNGGASLEDGFAVRRVTLSAGRLLSEQ